MDARHLVQVFAHTGGDRGANATGYPVAPGRVLTARHAVRPDGATGAIEVRWYNLTGEARKWRAARVVWEGTADNDAAVLECEFPEEFRATPYLISSTEPSNLFDWESAGFAAAGAKGEEVPPTSLNGKVLTAGSEPCRSGSFALGVEFPTGSAEGWLGASGSPVFVGQRILGVVATAQRPFNGERLTATATCRLLHDESFRKAIGYVEKWKHLEDYRAKLVSALWDKRRAASKRGDDQQAVQDALKAGKCLASEMKLDSRERWRDDEAFARAVVGRLLHERLEDLLPRLTATRRALVEAGEVNSAEVAKKIAFLVMPAVCDVGEVDPSDWLGSGPALVRLPAATETLAEIILAAADRRAARFDRGGTRPEPRLRLQPPPSGGETTSLARFEEQWRAYVIQKFVDPRDRAKAAQHETLTKLANVILDNHFKLRKERYYCIVEMANPGEAVYWEAIVARLRRDYPAVVFVTLLGTDDDLLRECFLRVHIDELLAPDDGEAAS